MNIEVTVKVKDTAERNYLYTILVNAAQGVYKDVLDSKDKDAIKELEDTFKKEFDLFANHYFNAGRTYEKENSSHT